MSGFPDAIAGRGAARNIVRHAGARKVHIALSHHAGAMHLLLEDDGRGFDAAR
ncbi:MAG: hypothetical protein Q8O52_26320 [Sulfuritalea sp.]|nr:hypothetical protein [Sulfuritalea sp.]